MEKVVGKRMYRGLLKSVAKVWNPRDIPERNIQEKVLAYLQAAERGLHRALAAEGISEKEILKDFKRWRRGEHK